ncbi:MAG: high frequency lysogenization protein HflD [Campylobacterota bacterium]|nr:high frequency lysogenization protein HflD [Campylobacterota bacterium]
MEVYNSLLHTLVGWQYELNSFISTTIRALNDESTLSGSLLVLGIAFVYGLIHAAGPGHGKALVAFYFTSNKSDYKKAFKMGYMISIIHAISALIFTFSIYFILKTMFRKNFNEFSDIAMQVSAVMIIGVGIYLIYEAYSARKYKEKKIEKSSKSESAVAFSAGVVPCPGVMTIVLFCIVLGQFTLGVLAAIAMSIGMGLTISLAGIFSIALNKKAGGLLNEKSYLLEMIGGLLIFSLGVFLLLSTTSSP